MNKELDLLTLLGDMYDQAIDYSMYSKECSEDEIKLMLKDLINRIIELNDFIFENVDLDKLSE